MIGLIRDCRAGQSWRRASTGSTRDARLAGISADAIATAARTAAAPAKGELDGLKLVGFAVWQKSDGKGQNVSFPSRQFTVHGERRSFSLLRWIANRNAQERLENMVIQAYADLAQATAIEPDMAW